MAKIFSILTPDFVSKPKRLGLNYLEPIDDIGFCEMGISGPAYYGGAGEPFAQLQTTGRMALADGWDGAKPAFDRMHDLITEAFTRLIKPEFRPI
jgi:hypothetical protein